MATTASGDLATLAAAAAAAAGTLVDLSSFYLYKRGLTDGWIRSLSLSFSFSLSLSLSVSLSLSLSRSVSLSLSLSLSLYYILYLSQTLCLQPGWDEQTG